VEASRLIKADTKAGVDPALPRVKASLGYGKSTCLQTIHDDYQLLLRFLDKYKAGRKE